MNRSFACFVMLFGAIVPSNVMAANKTYIAAAGQGTWSVDSFWSPFGAPLGGDNAFLTPSDANNRTVIFNVGGPFFSEYGNVTVNSSGTGTIVLQNTGKELLVDENVRKAYLGED